MACTHCPHHCPNIDVTEALRLDGPPSAAPTPGGDMRFYRTFAVAYEAARAARLRPRQALMAANPWLSASQCSAYLRRARALGLVSAPTRVDAGQRRGAVPAGAGTARVAGRATDTDDEEEAPRPVATSRQPRRGSGSRPVDAYLVGNLLYEPGELRALLESRALQGRLLTLADVRNAGHCSEPVARAVLTRAVADEMGELQGEDSLQVWLEEAPEHMRHLAKANAVRRPG